MELQKHYVNGTWLDPISNEECPVYNPANESQIGTITLGNEADVNRAVAAAAQLRAGAIHINGGQYNYGSPFGGYKQSGNGREGGLIGLEDYQEVKTLHFAR